MKDINLFPTKDSSYLQKVKSKSEISLNDESMGYLIESSEKEARRIVESLKGKGKIIAVVGGDDAFNRRAIETLKIDYLVSPEKNVGKDTLKQRDSGMNHVIAKLAAEKKISMVIDFSEVSKLSGKEKALRLEKLIQNVKICRKVGCKIKIASLSRDEKGLVDGKARSAFGTSLGMSSVQAFNSTEF
ncbi:MAG: hypothetical protein KKF50_05225 [Nanoarchaeota archaeon]|nr:hypothetical protein [Nanoarchaeota archaeon]